MKILYIIAQDDYDALRFEEIYSSNLSIELWQKVKTGEVLKDRYGNKLYIKALEFDNVDKNFVDFIKNQIQDYDHSKHTNFYICN